MLLNVQSLLYGMLRSINVEIRSTLNDILRKINVTKSSKTVTFYVKKCKCCSIYKNYYIIY